ncbi:hypothetical protein [uncultured Microscilla sp.]|uniref:hypothetical protein n=1 Tax=uncultured Microscilla sp. TaxID=432653 RepID=UPI00263A1680|nr:hypothetical protein [uncultured Microscilla sp.]
MAKVRTRGIEVAIGEQGVGKTFVAVNYAEAYTKKHNEPVVVFDPNREKAYAHWEEVKLADVPYLTGQGCYRVSPVDEYGEHTDNLLPILLYLLKWFSNGLLIAEDINTISVGLATHALIKVIVNVRHKGLDLLLNFQSPRAVAPRILDNLKWIRLHKSASFKKTVENYESKRIAELIIRQQVKEGNYRCYLYLDHAKNLIKGASNHQIKMAAREYLTENISQVKQTIYVKLKIKKDSETAREKALNYYLKEKNYFQPYF